MKYLKNTDLAEMYKVSEDTITNWVKAAKGNKINLQVVEEGKRTYIVNSSENLLVLRELSIKGRKYKNRRTLKLVSPKPEFYEVFTEDQIIDLVADLEANREIDLKHVYFRDGEKSWDDYVIESLNEKSGNTPKNTIELLQLTQDYIYELIRTNSKINIVDVGVGNGMTIRAFLEFMISKGIVNKYVGIDYSLDVINKAKANLISWFGDSLQMEFHLRDFTYQGIKDILFINTQGINQSKDYANLILFVGSTIENQRLHDQALNIIKNSLGPSDVFVLGQTLDAYTLKLENKLNKAGHEAFFFILDLLNIDSKLFDLNGFYDEKTDSRFIRAELKADVNISIQTKRIKKIIRLSSREHIILLRHKHHKLIDIVKNLSSTGFDILNLTTSLDHANVNTISKLPKTETT
jgi:uncharacterized SAM-dependent methyltransferase